VLHVIGTPVNESCHMHRHVKEEEDDDEMVWAAIPSYPLWPGTASLERDYLPPPQIEPPCLPTPFVDARCLTPALRDAVLVQRVRNQACARCILACATCKIQVADG